MVVVLGTSRVVVRDRTDDVFVINSHHQRTKVTLCLFGSGGNLLLYEELMVYNNERHIIAVPR